MEDNKYQGLILPDLSAWGAVEILTVDEAALLWGGIDPAYCRHFSDAEKCRYEQYQQAFIARRAFLAGISLGTLPTNELWCINYQGDSYLHVDKQLPSITEIDTSATTVNSQALISWAEKKRVKTLKQAMSAYAKYQREQKERREFEKLIKNEASQHPASIEYRPLEPNYNTPEFETACEVIKKYWNSFDGRGKPPKEIEIKEYIEKVLTEKLGGKPTQAAINRVDTLTRPPQFKNQQKTLK
jgi:hypothetical protein|nr:MAG TPA: hypothetical protein [Caudoviricetes sp.]